MEVSALSISPSFIPAVVLLIMVPAGPLAHVGGHPSALVPYVLCGYSPQWPAEVQGLLPPLPAGEPGVLGKDLVPRVPAGCWGAGHSQLTWLLPPVAG